MNVRVIDAKTVGISFDETSKLEDVDGLLKALNGGKPASFTAASLAPSVQGGVGSFARSSTFLQHPVFNSHHDEHSMLRCSLRSLSHQVPPVMSPVHISATHLLCHLILSCPDAQVPEAP